MRNLSARLFSPLKHTQEAADHRDIETLASDVLAELLPPAEWTPVPEGAGTRPFNVLSARSFLLLCKHMQRLFAAEPTLVKLRAPVKVRLWLLACVWLCGDIVARIVCGGARGAVSAFVGGARVWPLGVC